MEEEEEEEEEDKEEEEVKATYYCYKSTVVPTFIFEGRESQ